MEELKDLEQEVEDAQFAFDADFQNMVDATNHITRSYKHLRECEDKLKQYVTKI